MSNKSVKLVVFDWEGTLADSLGEIFQAIAIQAQAFGLGDFDLKKARQYAGMGLAKAIQKLYPELNQQQLESFLEAVQKTIHSHHQQTCLFPKALNMLQTLHEAGIHLAIASNKGHQSLVKVLSSCQLLHFFPKIKTASDCNPKPCPDMLSELMEFYQVDATETLMVGDSDADMQMAKTLNVPAIGVDFYAEYSQSLIDAGAVMVIDDYNELLQYLDLKGVERE